jgi:hypothetical protein
MREARILIPLLLICGILTIVLALVRHAHGADAIIECSAARMSDRAHWAWREINGKKCWYRGEPGRPKALLRWDPSPRPSVEAGRPEIGRPSEVAASDLAADPVTPTPIKTEEVIPSWQPTTEDQLLAFTCCWPELPTVKTQERYEQTPIPKATPPVMPLWPLIFLPVTVLAGAVLLVKRRLT